VSTPGASGPNNMRVLGSQRIDFGFDGRGDRVVGSVAAVLRTADVGAVRGWGVADAINEGGGNLETIPPHPGFPLGRLVVANLSSVDPKYRAFLEAQEVQGPPLSVALPQFNVGHIDEVLSFVPSKTSSTGWVPVVPDPVLALEILQKLVRDGKGDALVFDPTDFPRGIQTNNQHAILGGLDVFGLSFPRELRLMSVAQLVDPNVSPSPLTKVQRESLINSWRLARTKIEVIANTIRSITGVEPLRLPVFVTARGGYLLPNAVNLVASDSGILVPRPYGPKVDGVAVLEREIAARFAAAGVPNVHFVDTMVDVPVHSGAGELHCATNAYRELPHLPEDAWWRRIQRGARANGGTARLYFDCPPPSPPTGGGAGGSSGSGSGNGGGGEEPPTNPQAPTPNTTWPIPDPGPGDPTVIYDTRCTYEVCTVGFLNRHSCSNATVGSRVAGLPTNVALEYGSATSAGGFRGPCAARCLPVREPAFVAVRAGPIGRPWAATIPRHARRGSSRLPFRELLSSDGERERTGSGM